jgi:formylglycine-generating enzyme required for sulfatase activity
MALVPAGSFIMGSDEEERALGYRIGGEAAIRYRWFDIEERRRVSFLPAYCIDVYLVTNRDYRRFVQATGHRVPFISKEDYLKQGFLVHDYERGVTKFLWQDDRYPSGTDEHPVVLVSVEDAVAYCRWRGGQEGKSLRLPTEEEWEKAARGTDGRYFPWDNEWDPTCLNSAERGPYYTTPVGSYPRGKSPYGLYDMAGNVFQWTASTFRDGRQVLKGCSWDDQAGLCRAAFRHGRPPTSRHILIGFRCASSVANPLLPRE